MMCTMQEICIYDNICVITTLVMYSATLSSAHSTRNTINLGGESRTEDFDIKFSVFTSFSFWEIRRKAAKLVWLVLFLY